MPSTPPYAKLLVAVNGGAPASGKINCATGDSVQLSAESTVGYGQIRWEIRHSPPGFTQPTGWLTDGATGAFYSNDTSPPIFTLDLWGKYLLGLYPSTSAGVLKDEATGLTIESPSGLQDLSPLEETQFGLAREGWAADQQINLRVIEDGLAAIAGGIGAVDFGTDPSSIHSVRGAIASGPGYSASSQSPTGTAKGITCFGMKTIAGTSAGATGKFSVVGGGIDNDATGGWSVASGGSGNVASGDNSAIPGGNNNVASGQNSLAMGDSCKATGWCSAAIGFSHEAYGDHSFAHGGGGARSIRMGQYSHTSTDGLDFGDGDTGQNSYNRLNLWGRATGASTIELLSGQDLVISSGTHGRDYDVYFWLEPNCTYGVLLDVVATKNVVGGGATSSTYFTKRLLVSVNAAGVATIDATQDLTVLGGGGHTLTVDIVAAVVGPPAVPTYLRVRVAGTTAFKAQATVKWTEISHT